MGSTWAPRAPSLCHRGTLTYFHSQASYKMADFSCEDKKPCRLLWVHSQSCMAIMSALSISRSDKRCSNCVITNARIPTKRCLALADLKFPFRFLPRFHASYKTYLEENMLALGVKAPSRGRFSSKWFQTRYKNPL